jgi:hypothetical protein
MDSVSVQKDLLLIISKEEDRMPNRVEMELQGVFELVVLLYIQIQQDCNSRG